MFKYDWIKSGVPYVKDLLDGESNIKDLRSTAKVFQKKKSNWLSKYKVIATTLKPFL